jgi:hypothetical protein
MDLDDLFDFRRRKHPHREHGHDPGPGQDAYPEHDDHRKGRDSPSGNSRWRDGVHRQHRHHDDDEWFGLAQVPHRLLANTRILFLAGAVLLAVTVLAAVFVLPLLGQILDLIERDGLKGLLDRAWQGTGESGSLFPRNPLPIPSEGSSVQWR